MQRVFNICKSINMIYHTNKLKNEKRMIISKGAEDAFGKSQHSFVIEILRKVGIEETHLKEGHLNKHL